VTHSQACRDLVASFEGLRLNAYQDQNGVWTIGYGHTADVKPGDTCTKEQAEEWLDEDLEEADQAIARLVDVPLTQNQYDAIASLVFNIGEGHFSGSTVRRRLNQNDFSAAAEAILMWRYAGGEVSVGLLHRRQAERKLFLGEP